MIISVKALFLIVVALLPLLVGEYLRYQRSHFSCDSEITLQSTDGKFAHVIMSYRFDNNEGSYNSTGSYVDNGKSITINNHFTFDFYIEPGHFVLISREDKNNPGEQPGESSIIPDFFHYRGRGVSMQVNKENSVGYLISIGNTPIFYCKRQNI